MKRTVRVALIGDHDPAVPAHRAIPPSLARAGARLGLDAGGEWIHTSTLTGEDAAWKLAGFDGIWCVPASPYASFDGALAAIRFARTAPRPYLGTCGGFQHALIEFARNVLGLADADHAESNPGAALPLIGPLSCPLVGVRGRVRLLEGTRLREAVGRSETVEGFHCRFGLDPRHRERVEREGLRISAVDDAGEPRAIELERHPFFVGTLFQPELAAQGDGAPHPIVVAFVAAASRRSGSSTPL